jgi:hypothetical protein
LNPGERPGFRASEDVTEVRARALPSSSSKMRAAAVLMFEAARLAEEAASEAETEAPPAVAVCAWMKPELFASYRGVSVETVRRWCQAGMPHTRRGRVIRIDKGDADRWLSSNLACFSGKTRERGSCPSLSTEEPGVSSAPPKP